MNASPQPPPAPTPDELLAGGKPLTVKVIDAAHKTFGQLEVLIRLVPMREYPAMRAELTNMGALIERFCGQAKGWAETVTPASRARP
jgi:hypothetical protein